MTPSVAIRNAEPDDAESIAGIHVASWQATYRGLLPDSYLDSLTSEQRLPMWTQLLTSPQSFVKVWVAEMEDGIVGFCSIGPAQSPAEGHGETLELYTIYLRPDRERQGTGRALMEQAEREMVRMGAGQAILWVLAGNDRATRFYEASGWKPDGVDKLDQLFGQTVREMRYSKRLAADRSW